MTQVIYMMPKRTHLSWDPRLEPLDLETEPGIEVPLLGYVSAGRPVETPEEQETIRVPSHMTRKASYALRVRGHSIHREAAVAAAPTPSPALPLIVLIPPGHSTMAPCGIR